MASNHGHRQNPSAAHLLHPIGVGVPTLAGVGLQPLCQLVGGAAVVKDDHHRARLLEAGGALHLQQVLHDGVDVVRRQRWQRRAGLGQRRAHALRREGREARPRLLLLGDAPPRPLPQVGRCVAEALPVVGRARLGAVLVLFGWFCLGGFVWVVLFGWFCWRGFLLEGFYWKGVAGRVLPEGFLLEGCCLSGFA